MYFRPNKIRFVYWLTLAYSQHHCSCDMLFPKGSRPFLFFFELGSSPFHTLWLQKPNETRGLKEMSHCIRGHYLFFFVFCFGYTRRLPFHLGTDIHMGEHHIMACGRPFHVNFSKLFNPQMYPKVGSWVYFGTFFPLSTYAKFTVSFRIKIYLLYLDNHS